MTDENPYAPPSSVVTDFEPINHGSVGLKWGIIFASPFILLFVAYIIKRNPRNAWPFFPLAITPIFAGRWWALRGLSLDNGSTFNGAVLHGVLQAGGFVCINYITHRYLYRAGIGLPIFGSFMIMMAIFTVISLVLNRIIRLKLQNDQTSTAQPNTEQPEFIE